MMRFIFIIAIFLIAAMPSHASAQDEGPEAAMPIEMYEQDPALEQPAQTVAGAGGDVVAALPDPSSENVANNRIDREINEKLSYLRPDVNVNAMPSLFMSLWEHDLIIDARRGLVTRDPISNDGVTEEAGPRDISLGGIVYHSSVNWTIWLNSMRVSPTAIPKQVMDLKVFKSYVEIEWFDETTNQIFPIRLRPQQRFNLDTRMFLPG